MVPHVPYGLDTAFPDELLAVLTVHAQDRIREVVRLGLGRPRSAGQEPRTVDGLSVPTGGTIATLVLAGERGEPVAELVGALKHDSVGARQRRDVIRTSVNRSFEGDAASFKPEWLDALGTSCDLNAEHVAMLHAAKDHHGELDPTRTERLVRAMMRAQSAARPAEQERGPSVRAVATWLEALGRALAAPPPWAVDAPPDIPRSLSKELSPRLSVVVGGSGEGKSRWLAGVAADRVERLLDQPMSEVGGAESALPLHASAHAFMSRLRRLAAQADDADPWQALVTEATQCVVGRMPPAEVGELRRAILEHIYRGQPVCVCLDALDELPAADLRELTQPNPSLSNCCDTWDI
jgi:hypothetical protein